MVWGKNAGHAGLSAAGDAQKFAHGENWARRLVSRLSNRLEGI